MSATTPLESLYQEDVYLMPPRTLVVLAKDWLQYSESEQLLLSKILGSVKLTLASVQVITQPSFTSESVAAFAPRQIISFGASSGSLKKYEAASLGSIQIVLADGLEELDDVRKKNLWTALKQMFAV